MPTKSFDHRWRSPQCPLLVAVVGIALALGPGRATADDEVSSPPPVAAPNPDVPTRTVSGKVEPSRDPRLAPALGPVAAKVLVVVFSDFQCPVCRRITDATHQIAEEWPGDVRVEFHNLPLKMHANAENAAVAALAAHRQGKFWEMHDLLFANQQALDPASLEADAQKLGLDLARFKKDVADPTLRARVRADAALAERLGATATPAFLVNGALNVGWGSWFAFRTVVEKERATVNDLLAKGTKPGAVLALRAQAALPDPAAFAAYEKGILAPLAAAGRRTGKR
jgi:protein-disulfide isomerase